MSVTGAARLRPLRSLDAGVGCTATSESQFAMAVESADNRGRSAANDSYVATLVAPWECASPSGDDPGETSETVPVRLSTTARHRPR